MRLVSEDSQDVDYNIPDTSLHALKALAYSPDGLTLAMLTDRGELMTAQAGESTMLSARTRVREETLRCLCFSPDSRRVALGTSDVAIKLFDLDAGKMIDSFLGHSFKVESLAWSRNPQFLASVWDDASVRLYDFKLREHSLIYGDARAVLSWSPDGGDLAIGSKNGTLNAWSLRGQKLRNYRGKHDAEIVSISWSPRGDMLVTSSLDHTIRIWDTSARRLLKVLEGHTGAPTVNFAHDGALLVSSSSDGKLLFFDSDSWECVGRLTLIPRDAATLRVAVHPHERIIAIGPLETGCIRILGFNVAIREAPLTRAHRYANAKVVLVGDSGVGKSGLALVLTGRPYAATESTHGRHVWPFESITIKTGESTRTRETLLWDLAGQPGYRVVHQLHLKEVSVALIVFDAHNEVDPLAGVRHWNTALTVARQHERSQPVSLKKFLVAARTDREGIALTDSRIERVKQDFGMDFYCPTSAKMGWNIDKLREHISSAIEWEELPEVLSSDVFQALKKSILQEKDRGRLLATPEELYQDFLRCNIDIKEDDPRKQFEACLGRLENRGLTRSLSFGYVLLQPEFLDGYASAMVNAAKNEPDGLGSLGKDEALRGNFHIPEDQRVPNSAQERLLLHATVEELLRHDLALTESTEAGTFLVFPSHFVREYEDAPEPTGTTVEIAFEGPVLSIYATLVVRLSHSGRFESGRTQMWRNAARFWASPGGICGIHLSEFTEAAARLRVFFDKQASEETQFQFENYVLSHLERRCIRETIKVSRRFVCPCCGNTVPEEYVSIRLKKGLQVFYCACDTPVQLEHPGQKLAKRFPSKVAEMNSAANYQRDFAADLISAKAVMNTEGFVDWAGHQRVTKAIVFTDVVGSAALGQELGDEEMNNVRKRHFSAGRKLLKKYSGYEIKTIGDCLMLAFHDVSSALDFCLQFYHDPGEERIRMRAGIHVGIVQLEGEDAFGSTVDFASRVVGAIRSSEIWLSERAKADIDLHKAARHKSLIWHGHKDIELKSFPGLHTLWSVREP